MRIPLCAVVISLASACASDTPEPTRDTVPGPADSGVTPGTAQQAREIYIDSVSPTNPIVVWGRARTFENNVQVRALDARGGQFLGQTFTTSDGEMGHHNPFAVRLFITRDPGDYIIVQAFEYSAKDGSERSVVSDTVPYAVENIRATLDFPTTECTVTRPFVREIPKSVAMARLLTQALVNGPTSEESAAGAAEVFPDGSRINDVTLADGVLTVDFNERLQNVGGSCAAQGIRASVTRTLERLPTVRSVVITAGGSRDQALQP